MNRNNLKFLCSALFLIVLLGSTAYTTSYAQEGIPPEPPVLPHQHEFTAPEGSPNREPATASITPDVGILIDNGTIQLGVNDTGNLNVDGGSPSSGTGTTVVGLRYLPTNAESTAPGCQCEGWGLGDNLTFEWGGANNSVGGVTNLTINSFTTTADSAISDVNVGSTFRVIHDYHPSPDSPNLYEVIVTIENISGATVEPIYRRAMDWDIEPTPFNEYVTIQASGGVLNLLFSSDNGFTDMNPFNNPGGILFIGTAVDSGPADHGAVFDFGFNPLDPGETISFRTFYGAAANEADALAAITTVAAQVYSLGQSANDPTGGTPNTFLFGFGGLGGKIGDYIWDDTNQDGIQDIGETGINGALVNLYLDNGDNIPDPGTDFYQDTVASYNDGTADGYFEFSNLLSADYFLEFVLPSGYTFSPQDQGGDDALDSDANTTTGLTEVFFLQVATDDFSWDAGMFGTPTALIGDYIWNDANQDGIQNVTESGINGIAATLYRDNGDAVPNPATDYFIDTTISYNNGGDGYYEFPSLAEGAYFVAFDLPSTYVITTQDAGGDDALDNDADPLTGFTDVFFLPDAAADDTVDAGYIPAYSIGDYIWVDVNGDGIQSGGEVGQVGVTVNLYADVDGDGLPEPGGDDGAAVDTAVTDLAGAYLFATVPIGDYFVEFVLPGGYIFSPQDQGGNDTLDSDADTVTGLTAVFSLFADDTSRDAGMSPLPIIVDNPGDIIDAGSCFTLTIGDLPGPDGFITLREAICAANNTPGLNLITFDAALNGTPIVLTTTGMWEDNNEFGDLDIRDHLVIQGSGTTNTIVDGNATDRVFHLPWTGIIEVTLNDLTITNGNMLFSDAGGGIYNGDGELTLNNVLLENNQGSAGGAIFTCCTPFSTLTLNNSTLQFNTSGDYGGGIYARSQQVAIEASNILNNTAGASCCGYGGGLFLENGGGNITTINQSSISGNNANGGDGGGIYNNTNLTLTNSTLSGNTTTGAGGGLVNWNTLALNHSTITDNDASFGGGLYGFGTTNVKNSIIAGNTNGGSAPDDCNAGFASFGGNVFGNGTGCFPGGGDTTVNPPDVFTLLLNPTLALNGGTTLNHALLTGGAAVDFATDCTTVGGAPVTVDQRNIARPFGVACDSGAYELIAGAIWDGEGLDNNWSTALNWVGDVVPTAVDLVIFNTTSTRDAIIDGAFVGQVGGILIDVGYTGTITMARSLQVAGNYTQNDGTMIVGDPSTALLTVGGTVTHNGGVLGQTRNVGSGVLVSFLQIEDGGAIVKYRGVNLDTTTSGTNLGDVTVLVRAIDPGAGEYCTTTGGSSPAYAERCYTITPTTDGPALVRLWALNSELNGIAEVNLSVYRRNAGVWTELTTNRATGNDGVSYSYGEGDTPGFSSFLLGEATFTPTAVTLQNFSASNGTMGTAVILLLVMMVGMTAVLLRRKHT